MKDKHHQPKKVSKWPKVVFVLGMLVLVVGAAMFIWKMVAQPATEDAEFLVSTGEWTREDQPSVIWDFTETGKGKLTTDNHVTDYDFTWTLKDGKLVITTDWLYELDNEFSYTLDQGSKVLTLTVPEKNIEIIFKADK